MPHRPPMHVPAGSRARRLRVLPSDAPTRKTAEQGYGSEWQTARLYHLADEPFCRACKVKGVVVLATVVDHVRPHRRDRELFWDRTNWQSLCKACHDFKTGRGE